MVNFVKKLTGLPVMACFLAVLSLVSCKDDKTGSGERDRSKPFKLTSFYPETGPIATQVIMSGENLGNNPEEITVYFNEKKAAIISATGEKMLALAPKLPGDECVISVVIDGDSLTYDKYFNYITQTTITTLVGGDRNSETIPEETMSLAEAQFNGNLEFCMYVDEDDNLFMSMDKDGFRVFLINEEADRIRPLGTFVGFFNSQCIGYNPLDGQIYRMWTASGSHEYFVHDKANDYIGMDYGNISWDDNSFTGTWKRAFNLNPADGKFYFVNGGSAGRFDPETAQGENLTRGRTFGPNGGETYGIAFDPNNLNMMYFSNQERHCIYRYDIENDIVEHYTGTEGTSGYLDGPVGQAMFNQPMQIAFDSEGLLYVADRHNHCIRRINIETGYVSTVAGIPQTAGYVNGSAAVAQFDQPCGIAINSDDVIYINDGANRAVRRLAIE